MSNKEVSIQSGVQAETVKARRNFSLFPFLARIPLIVWTFVVIYPILWMILSSFKTNSEIYAAPWSLPTSWNLDNYIRAWTEYDVSVGIFNSLFVTAIGTVLNLAVSVPAAYSIGRMKFKLSKPLYLTFVFSLTIPTVLGLIPLFFLLLDFDLLNNLFVLGIIYAATRIPFSVFLLTGFMSAIPREIEEAAAIDGASRYQVLIRLVTPMLKPALITVTVMNAVTFWNEYFMALIFLPGQEQRTIGVVLDFMNRSAQYNSDWGGLFAALVISIIPIFIIYVFLQKKIIKGMIDGAIKD